MDLNPGSKPKKIVYCGIVGDLFHYGHLKLLLTARSYGDLLICGVLTDDATQQYRRKPVANFDERKEVILNIRCVDGVMAQPNLDPTENLKKIHVDFPDAKIILIYGSDWKDVPGREFVESINGEVIQPPYYERLQTHKIIDELTKERTVTQKNFDFFTEYFATENIIYYDGFDTGKRIISTKGDTLKSLKPLLKNSKIEKTLIFTISDWVKEKKILTERIRKMFYPHKIVIRSSALNEDTLHCSMAGHFKSVLDVHSEDETGVKNAIEDVIASYSEKKQYDSSNQVLVQQQSTNVKRSGVVFTRTYENLPYYVINYEDGEKTDYVTKGISNKTVYVSKFTDINSYALMEWRALLLSIKEIECIITNLPLDIEFAINEAGDIIIFQVRPLILKNLDNVEDEKIARVLLKIKKDLLKILKSRYPHLGGQNTYLSDMSDWNPAEIIGNYPGYLDFSLYAHIITDEVWHKSRAYLGYADVNPAKLVIMVGNKPYVDVRNSFNSFVPSSLGFDLRDKLVSFYLEKLRKNPHLHDKIEFEIVYSCYDFSFDKRCGELITAGFTRDEVNTLKKSLIDLTNNIIKNSENLMKKDMDSLSKLMTLRENIKNERLEECKDPIRLIKESKKLIESCKQYGTIQFANLARFAFIGKIILKSMVSENVIGREFYDDYLNSINTVASELSNDFDSLMRSKMKKEEFISKYGHLRPGTYNIKSQRYDKREDIFDIKRIRNALEATLDSNKIFKIDEKTYQTIESFLRTEPVECNAPVLLEFIKKALELRELSKFEFTKNLSDGMEHLAKAAEIMGFTREDLAYLDVETIFESSDENKSEEIIKKWRKKIDERKNNYNLQNKLFYPPLIFTEEDIYLVRDYSSKPNFITQKIIEGIVLELKGGNEQKSLEKKIVFIENADPGYDWIFTRDIAGLVTKYGGVASHMSIRCAEFSIPAAIGCGEKYDNLKKFEKIVLDCKSKMAYGIGDFNEHFHNTKS